MSFFNRFVPNIVSALWIYRWAVSAAVPDAKVVIFDWIFGYCIPSFIKLLMFLSYLYCAKWKRAGPQGLFRKLDSGTDSELPDLDLQHCVQYPGDLIFLPSKFFHTTVIFAGNMM